VKRARRGRSSTGLRMARAASMEPHVARGEERTKASGPRMARVEAPAVASSPRVAREEAQRRCLSRMGHG
jgi:hypothetical protein